MFGFERLSEELWTVIMISVYKTASQTLSKVQPVWMFGYILWSA